MRLTRASVSPSAIPACWSIHTAAVRVLRPGSGSVEALSSHARRASLPGSAANTARVERSMSVAPHRRERRMTVSSSLRT